MSQWNKIQTYRLYDTIAPYYEEYFPIEVRSIFSNWLEAYIFTSGIDPDNYQHSGPVSTFMTQLLQQIQSEIGKNEGLDEQSFFRRRTLVNASAKIQQKYSNDPASLYRTLQYCLNQELTAIQLAEQTASPASNSPAPPVQPQLNVDMVFRNELDKLIASLNQDTNSILNNMKAALERTQIKQNDILNLESAIFHTQSQPGGAAFLAGLMTEKQQKEQEINQYKNIFVQSGNCGEDKIQGIVTELTKIQKGVLKEINDWREEQRQSGNGRKIVRQLKVLQTNCEKISEIVIKLLQQLKEIENYKLAMGLTDGRHRSLKEQVCSILKELVIGTFVVEHQPPQVVQTKTKIGTAMTVRLLVGGTLNQYLTPEVHVTLISGSQAYALCHHPPGEFTVTPLGPLTNCKGDMKFDSLTGRFFASFSNIKMPERIVRKGNRTAQESVAEEKACFHFQTNFSVGEMTFPIYTLSLPISVTVHKSQEPQAWGTITWDNAFAEVGRLPFEIPERVPFERVADMLNTKYSSITGRDLTEGNIAFLKQKLFRGAESDGIVTWSLFYKDDLPGTSFKTKDNKEVKLTFWQWFYYIMELIQSKCQALWQAGRIEGFISKDDTQNKLLEKPPGTFLLRFSDSKQGGITIAWVHTDQKVYSVQPYVVSDLETRSLEDRINDLAYLHFLYPNIPKSTAFAQTAEPEVAPGAIPTIKRGYVTPRLTETVPVVNSLNSLSSAGCLVVPNSSPRNYSRNGFTPTSPFSDSGMSSMSDSTSIAPASVDSVIESEDGMSVLYEEMEAAGLFF